MRVYETAVMHVNEEHYHPQAGHIGDNTTITLNKLVMAKHSQINAGTCVVGMGDFYIGVKSTVGYNVTILTATDTPKGKVMNDYAPPEERHVVRGSVTIKDGCSIGSGAVICVSEKNPHIVIDDNTVVQARSYVGRSIGPNIIYAKCFCAEMETGREA